VTVEWNPSGSEGRLQFKARANFLKMVEYIRFRADLRSYTVGWPLGPIL